MKNHPEYNAYMRFMAIALSLAIFAFVIPTIHNFLEHLYIYKLGVNELNKPLEALTLVISSVITIPIYNIFYEELIK